MKARDAIEVCAGTGWERPDAAGLPSEFNANAADVFTDQRHDGDVLGFVVGQIDRGAGHVGHEIAQNRLRGIMGVVVDADQGGHDREGVEARLEERIVAHLGGGDERPRRR